MSYCKVVHAEPPLRRSTGREIPEDVAAKTDKDNVFPVNMWRKLGKAG